MLDSDRMKTLFAALDEKLRQRGIVGEIAICGGAVMCLVFQARKATRDIDAVFAPTAEIREAALEIALEFGEPEDWLNDAAKAFFISSPPLIPALELPNLRVLAPPAEYMLAMKCISARFDGHDKDDASFLIQHLKLNAPEKVFNVIAKYYPNERIPPQTTFLIQEFFEAL